MSTDKERPRLSVNANLSEVARSTCEGLDRLLSAKNGTNYSGVFASLARDPDVTPRLLRPYHWTFVHEVQISCYKISKSIFKVFCSILLTLTVFLQVLEKGIKQNFLKVIEMEVIHTLKLPYPTKRKLALPCSVTDWLVYPRKVSRQMLISHSRKDISWSS